MIKPGLYDRMSKAGDICKSLEDSDGYYIFINADLLNGCQFKCSGCFVNKGVNSHDLASDMDNLVSFSNEVNQSRFHLEEFVLGPTDFFSAKNAEEVISHPGFSQILAHKDTKLVILSTLQSSFTRIEQRLSLLEKQKSFLDIDLLIPIEIERALCDSSFFDGLRAKWHLIEQSSFEFDPSFQVNIASGDYLQKNPQALTDLSKKVRDEFDTILEFNPSLLSRGDKNYEKLRLWQDIFAQNLSKGQVMHTSQNKDHTGANNLVLNFRRGEFYVCPFIYENVFVYNQDFLIPKKDERYVLDDIINFKQENFVEQMEYSAKADQCFDCNNLVSCSYKNVLSYMKHLEVKSCLFQEPEKKVAV